MNSYWAIIPAAGTGNRFGNHLPKQYQKINGLTVLEHTVNILLKNDIIKQIVIALSPEDRLFQQLPLRDNPNITTVMGGDTRMHSVRNALNWINKVASENDWVLVHDAARPCLHPEDLNNLITTVANDPVGGILASPVSDTLKFASSTNHISHTVARNSLWQALTPQLFRCKLLNDGLGRCEGMGIVATDEAQVIEQLGLASKIVKSLHPNPKLTYLSDIKYLCSLLQPVEAPQCA